MISITCPNGFGETDRARCLDRAACLLPPLACLLCNIPVALIAQGGTDPVNRKLAARLPGLISCPWKAPKVTKAQERQRAAAQVAETARDSIRRVARLLPPPCTVHRFFMTMKKFRAPDVPVAMRGDVLRAVGYVVAKVDGIERITGTAA